MEVIRRRRAERIVGRGIDRGVERQRHRIGADRIIPLRQIGDVAAQRQVAGRAEDELALEPCLVRGRRALHLPGRDVADEHVHTRLDVGVFLVEARQVDDRAAVEQLGLDPGFVRPQLFGIVGRGETPVRGLRPELLVEPACVVAVRGGGIGEQAVAQPVGDLHLGVEPVPAVRLARRERRARALGDAAEEVAGEIGAFGRHAVGQEGRAIVRKEDVASAGLGIVGVAAAERELEPGGHLERRLRERGIALVFERCVVDIAERIDPVGAGVLKEAGLLVEVIGPREEGQPLVERGAAEREFLRELLGASVVIFGIDVVRRVADRRVEGRARAAIGADRMERQVVGQFVSDPAVERGRVGGVERPLPDITRDALARVPADRTIGDERAGRCGQRRAAIDEIVLPEHRIGRAIGHAVERVVILDVPRRRLAAERDRRAAVGLRPVIFAEQVDRQPVALEAELAAARAVVDVARAPVVEHVLDIAVDILRAEAEAAVDPVRDRQVERAFRIDAVVRADTEPCVAAELAGRALRGEQHRARSGVLAEQRALRALEHLERGDVVEIEIVAFEPADIHVVDVEARLGIRIDLVEGLPDPADREARAPREQRHEFEVRHRAAQILEAADVLLQQVRAAEHGRGDGGGLEPFGAAARGDDDLAAVGRGGVVRRGCVLRGRERGRDWRGGLRRGSGERHDEHCRADGHAQQHGSRCTHESPLRRA